MTEQLLGVAQQVVPGLVQRALERVSLRRERRDPGPTANMPRGML